MQLLATLQTTTYRKQNKIKDSIIPIDENAARENFIKAARLGCSKSQLRLGFAYGTARLGCPKNIPVALHYFRLAARQGEADADFEISTWFGWGQPGILEANGKQAFVHARRAAVTGLVPALCQVGYFYESGIGVATSIPKAKEWYLKAAAKGDKTAQRRLDALRKRGSFGVSLSPG
jgi:TPR repeat protein